MLAALTSALLAKHPPCAVIGDGDSESGFVAEVFITPAMAELGSVLVGFDGTAVSAVHHTEDMLLQGGQRLSYSDASPVSLSIQRTVIIKTCMITESCCYMQRIDRSEKGYSNFG